jgi:hypothetical protein
MLETQLIYSLYDTDSTVSTRNLSNYKNTDVLRGHKGNEFKSLSRQTVKKKEVVSSFFRLTLRCGGEF